MASITIRNGGLLCSLLKQSSASALPCQIVKGSVKDITNQLPKSSFVLQHREYAARKGYRAMKMKNRVKKDIVIEEFMPYKLKKELANKPNASRRGNEESKPDPIDDVYLIIHHKAQVLSAREAIQAHREVHHPTMFNKPDAVLMATIELDMSTDKKTKFLSNLNRVVEVPYPYQKDELKKVLAFVNTVELQQAALEAGAAKAGGTELIKTIQTGDVRTAEFKYVVAHENVAEDLTALRGLLKTKFPATKTGSIGTDIVGLVRKFVNGMEYSSKSDVHEKDFGWVEIGIGQLSTPTEELEANLEAILKDLHSARARKGHGFVTKCVLWTKESKEKFVIEHKKYVPLATVPAKKTKPVPKPVEDELERATA